MKKTIALLLAILMIAAFAACAPAAGPIAPEEPVTDIASTTEEPETSEEPEEEAAAPLEAATVQLFIAASLADAFEEIIALYKASQPNVVINPNADSSGTLLTQVREGFDCDIFFSAATLQIKALADEGYMIEGTRVDLLCNKLALISFNGSGTAVTGLADIQNAKSIALADGSVPAGKYTREALIKLGLLDGAKPAADYTSAEVSEALGGVEINECGNVSKVKEAVKEGANEIGTVYYSDAYSIRDSIDVLEIVDTSLTGEILYPVCRVNNPEATEAQRIAADDFLAFLQTDAIKAIFANYMFIIYG